jgi:raffinose/stachyose/melibiose transport system permease protein
MRLRRWSALKRGQQGTAHLSQARQEKWAVWVFIYPPLAVYLAMVIWPMLFLFYLSLNKWTGFGPKTFVGFSNYIQVLSDDKFWLAAQHNGLWAIATLIGTTTTGLVLAVLLARTRVWASGFFQVVYFLPQMISSVVVAVIWRWIYYPSIGPLNVALETVGLGALQRPWLGEANLVLPALFVAYSWVAYGFAMLIFLAAIDSVEVTLFEAARIDGANWFQEIWYILLPAIRPALRTVFIIMGIWSFQIFDLVWLTTRGGPGFASTVLALLVYRNTFVESKVGIGSAMAFILSTFILVLALFALRRGEQENE